MNAMAQLLHKVADQLESSCDGQEWNDIRESVNETLGRTADEESIVQMMNDVTDCKAMLAIVYRKLEDIEKNTVTDAQPDNVVELKTAER